MPCCSSAATRAISTHRCAGYPRIAEHVFQAGEAFPPDYRQRGYRALHSTTDQLAGTLAFAIKSQRTAAEAGGNRSLRSRKTRTNPGRGGGSDRTWAHQIKSALMANRFRLVQQPIASLIGEERAMFDLVVRMLDERGQEVLPSEFLDRRRTHRPDEEHRSLGGRRGDVFLRRAQAPPGVRATVERLAARRDARPRGCSSSSTRRASILRGSWCS